MSSDTENTPKNAGPTRTITVEVPEDRVERFEALVERFLAGRRGRHRGHRHGPRGKRGGCRHGHADSQTTPTV